MEFPQFLKFTQKYDVKVSIPCNMNNIDKIFRKSLNSPPFFSFHVKQKYFFSNFDCPLSASCYSHSHPHPPNTRAMTAKMLVCIFSIHTQKNRKKLNIIPFRNVVMKTQHEKIFLYVCLCCLWRVSTAWEIENCEKRILCQKYGSFMRERVFIKIKQLSFIMCSVECARLVIIAVDFKKDAFNGHSWWRWMGII